MKKLIATIAALAMMALGLVAGLGSAATAGDYTNTVPTKTSASTPNIKKGKAPKTTVNVKANSDETVVGNVSVTYKGKGVNKTVKKAFSGKKLTVKGPKIKKPGKVKVTVKFAPKAGSVFKASKSSHTFKVKK